MGDKANTGGISDQAEVLAGLEDALQPVDDAELVLEWRLEQLERAGYQGLAAVELAERRDVDLHQALRLVERGCTPMLAARILL